MTEAKTSNMQQAVSALRRMIFSGELGPGSDHLETDLAEMLGMSRTPVREAMLVLAEQGLVLQRPRRGMRVIAISPQDMQDVYDVLTELESLAAEQAARWGYARSELAILEDAVDAMDRALDAEDLDAWARADGAFHRELVRLGRNPRVAMISRMMEDQVRRAKAITLHMRPLPLRSNEDHRVVLEAIAAQDAARARAVHHSHRRAARDTLVELLTKHRLQHL